MTEQLCVLTGDIVRSSRLPKARLEALMATLARSAESVRRWTSPPSPPLERFRGDGWQLVLTDPRWALRAGLVLRAGLRSTTREADSRIGFGVGSGQLAGTLAASGGAAFEHSGLQLEKLKGPERWSLQAEDLPSGQLLLARSLFLACEGWSRSWTCKQAEVVAHLLQPDEPSIAALAASQGVRPQTVQSHFAKAGGRNLLQVVHLYEEASA